MRTYIEQTVANQAVVARSANQFRYDCLHRANQQEKIIVFSSQIARIGAVLAGALVMAVMQGTGAFSFSKYGTAAAITTKERADRRSSAISSCT